MKKISKICINSSISISTNIAMLILCNKTTHSSPITHYSKPSTIRLLSEVFRNESGSFLSKLSNGQLKASFLYPGQTNHTPNNFPVKAGSTIYVKKSHSTPFKHLNLKINQRKLVENGVAFSIYTKSKSGLIKEINISTENGNIVVNSTKGYGTPNYILKRTTLEFGDGASTSSQSSSSRPKITVKRYSISDENSNVFDIEETRIYNPLNLNLISQKTKNKATKQSESITINENNTKTKIIKNPYGSSLYTIINSNGKTLFSKTTNADGNATETKKYNQDGSLIFTTSNYKFSDDSSFETTSSNSSTTTYERRSDGSLISILTTNSAGETFKQDFDTNNDPLNNPYKIN